METSDDYAVRYDTADDASQTLGHVTEVVGPGWLIAYRVVRQQSDMVVAEAKVSWAGNGPAPAGGLPSKVIRAMKPASALRVFREDVLWHFGQEGREAMAGASAALAWVALRGGGLEAARDVLMANERRQQLWAEIWRRHERTASSALPRLTRLARTAELQAAAGDRPNEKVAAVQGRTPERVRDDIRAARREGLLGPTRRGVAGGGLTERGIAILKEAEARR